MVSAFPSVCPVKPLPPDDPAHKGGQFIFTRFPCCKAGTQVAAGHGQSLDLCKQDAGPGGVHLLCLGVKLRRVADIPARDHQPGQPQDLLPAVQLSKLSSISLPMAMYSSASG